MASDEELRQRFFDLKIPEDVADLLGINLSTLNFILYPRQRPGIPPKYTAFFIPKRNKTPRHILAPNPGLKRIQQRLNHVLQIIYKPKPTVQGFTSQRSIKTNAQLHQKSKYVLNIDLKDFFPSINFGRVRGMFMAHPYNLPSMVATILAQICCYDNQLPQGAPTSPIISNMICSKMDNQLQYLAKNNQCTYTRYADDLTFSTRQRNFPRNVALTTSDFTGEHVQVSSELLDIIEGNGFALNVEKVRLQPKTRHQEVTGLTVNQTPNVNRRLIRQIRSMLHAWEKFGLEAAEREFAQRYNKKHHAPNKKAPSFKETLWGKIAFVGMVKGKDSKTYLAFRAKFRSLDPNTKTQQEKVQSTSLFICHSSKDDKVIEQLALNLRIAGFQTWVDHENIPVTEHTWDKHVEDALARCHKLVFVASENSIISDECRPEWNYYLEKKKPILLVLISKDIQENIPYRLKPHQFVEFYSEYEAGLPKLLKLLSS